MCSTLTDKYEYESIWALVWDYPAYDIADHLADVMPETLADGRRIWDMTARQLATLALDHYPGGAIGLQLALEGVEYATGADQVTVVYQTGHGSTVPLGTF